MTQKSIHEIKAEYGERASGILSRYHEAIDELAQRREPEAGTYLDRLSGEERARLLREQKAKAAAEIREAAIKDYRAATEDYHEQITARRSRLEERLFRVAGTPGEAVLPLASGATEEQLMGMLEDAITGASFDQARAVFLVARRRQLPGVLAAYFDRADPEAKELYEEHAEIPPAESLDRQLAGVETIIHEPGPRELSAAPWMA
jgi:hypothetical protein